MFPVLEWIQNNTFFYSLKSATFLASNTVTIGAIMVTFAA